MNKLIQFVLVVLVVGFIYPAGSVSAEEKVYGWELMSEQERNEHRTKLRGFNTEEERNRYRQEHHEMMSLRAKEKGVLLQDYRSNGMGDGRGGGQGGGRGR